MIEKEENIDLLVASAPEVSDDWLLDLPPVNLDFDQMALIPPVSLSSSFDRKPKRRFTLFGRSEEAL